MHTPLTMMPATLEKPRSISNLGVLVMLVCSFFWSSWRAGLAHAQEASPLESGSSGDTQELLFHIPAPKDRDQPLIVRVQVEQPYIDHVATYVTYDGWDRVFGIRWRSGQAS